MKVKDLKNFPIKIIHTHNSIPGFYDGLDEGCTTCIENKTIDLIGNKEIGLNEEKIKEICDKHSNIIQYKGSSTILHGIDILKIKDTAMLAKALCNTPNLIEFKEIKNE